MRRFESILLYANRGSSSSLAGRSSRSSEPSYAAGTILWSSTPKHRKVVEETCSGERECTSCETVHVRSGWSKGTGASRTGEYWPPWTRTRTGAAPRGRVCGYSSSRSQWRSPETENFESSTAWASRCPGRGRCSGRIGASRLFRPGREAGGADHTAAIQRTAVLPGEWCHVPGGVRRAHQVSLGKGNQSGVSTPQLPRQSRKSPTRQGAATAARR